MRIKNASTGKPKKQSASASRKKVALVRVKRFGLYRLKLIDHKHTFKLIHHRHTSHLALFVILAIVGLFMYASGNIAQAVSSSGTVMVGVIVPGPPPTIGATITSPVDGATVKDNKIINVSGTCSSNSFVIIKDNNITVGSAACTDAGLFSLQITLELGKNVLSAMNYDNLNQAGPETPSITVNVTETVKKTTPAEPVDNTPTLPTPPIDITAPIIPDNPSIITGVNSSFLSCNDYKPGKLSTGGEIHVAIVCVPRLFLPDMQQVMGVLVWGGVPPYALSINFGNETDGQPTLISLSEPGYVKVDFSYAVPDTYRIQLKLTDKKNETAVVETAVQVNGQKATPIATITKQIFGNGEWFQSPVPFYLLAVAITMGFWGGDIFDRKYGAKKFQAHTR